MNTCVPIKTNKRMGGGGWEVGWGASERRMTGLLLTGCGVALGSVDLT